MSFFQIVVTGIFATLVILGVGIFAIFGGAGGGGGVGTVIVWGTADQTTMDAVLEAASQTDAALEDVRYVSIPAANYEAQLINAIASGAGPDLFFLTQSNLGVLSDKLTPIPYSTVSQSTFINSYIDEGQLFLTPQGSFALPLVIDPLVMYWNRDMLTSAGVSQPPQYWDDLIALAPKLTSLDAGSVRKSTVALGTWSNIVHAKAIVSALFMQSGDFVTNRAASGAVVSTLGQKPDNTDTVPAAEALRFYTDFANPSKTTYSWNRSLPSSYQAFVSGDLGLYFGFASEYGSIAERNPNLRFGVATLPQLRGAPARITYGNIAGLAVARGSRNPAGALTVVQRLTGAPVIGALATRMGLPPVRRDVPVDTSASAAAAVFVQSALTSRSWADPSAPQTDNLFKVMVESVLSGRASPTQAVSEAASAMQLLLPTQ